MKLCQLTLYCCQLILKLHNSLAPLTAFQISFIKSMAVDFRIWSFYLVRKFPCLYYMFGQLLTLLTEHTVSSLKKLLKASRVSALYFNLGNGPSKNKWIQFGRLRRHLSSLFRIRTHSAQIQKVEAPPCIVSQNLINNVLKVRLYNKILF